MHSVGSEDIFMDAMSEAGSDFELELEEAEEEEDLDEHTFNWEKNKSFFPNVQPFMGETGLTPYILSKLSDNTSPLDIFEFFWDDEMIEEIIHQSNLYVTQIQSKYPEKMKDWKEVCKNELWCYFGLTMLMGFVKKPTIKEYWTTNPLIVTPMFGKIMSRNRFETITRGLHFANNENPNPIDRFWKLGIICTNLLEKYKKSINVGEITCIDESLLKFKGRLSIKQYLPFKRARFGVKFFGLVDNTTKMVVDYIPYQGKNTQIATAAQKALYGMGGAVVLKLLQPYLGCFRKVVMDNWFTSPALAQELLNQNTYCLGNIRKKRKFMPPMNSKLAKGEVETYVSANIMIER